MNKKLLSVALVLGAAYVAQGYTIFSNFATGSSTITTDRMEYRVVVAGGDQAVTGLGIGYFVAPDAGSFYVATTSQGANIAGWSVSTTTGTGTYTQNPAYVTPGTTQPGYSLAITGPNYYATSLTGLTAGTYYFGYKIPFATYNLGEVGFRVDGATQFLNDNWATGTDSGTGPVYAAVPEPTSFALIGLGAAVLALRRRKV
jgi:hypothetical protein